MAKVVTTEKPPYDPVPKVVEQQPGERPWQFEKRMREHQIKKGSRYVAMNIEPLVWERQRLATPMTAEDRFLRKQWVKDQILSPNEPRHIPSSAPQNIFRRFTRVPLDLFQSAVTKLVKNPTHGFIIRDVVKKFGLYYVAFLSLYIYCQNKEYTWETTKGIHVCGRRITRVPGDDPSKFPEDPKRFGMKGFDKRTTCVNGEY